MSASTRLTAAPPPLAALLIALVALPGVASARPADENRAAQPRDRALRASTPDGRSSAPSIKEEAVRALPIALAGAALLIAIGGTGFALVRIAPMRRQLS